MLILKPEYENCVLEYIRYEIVNIIFNTGIVPPEDYLYYYNSGFDWAFELTL